VDFDLLSKRLDVEDICKRSGDLEVVVRDV